MTKITKIISWNVNGIRSVLRKDAFYPMVSEYSPDIICLQEVRAIEKKGYSGTGIFSKIKPIRVNNGLGNFDIEGRVITAEYEDYFIVNVYVPNSKLDLSRLSYRIDEWDLTLRNYLLALQIEKPVIICGDFNIAYDNKLDLYNPKIKDTAGATENERNSFGKFLETFIDSFRVMNPEKIKFSWWSNLNNSRLNNHGWRIDYFLISPELINSIIEADILDKIMGSDHAPCLLVI